MRRTPFFVLLAFAVLSIVWGACFSQFPLGIPGEWTWNRALPAEPLGLALIPVAIVGALYTGFAWLGSTRVEQCRSVSLIGWLAGLSLAGFVWLWMAQEAAPESYQLSKAVWVLNFRGSSGYFSEARTRAVDLPKYLREYEDQMREGDVLHIGTHPPGLVVAVHGLLEVCRTSPALLNLLEAIQPASVHSSFDVVKQQEPLSRTDRGALWLALLLVQAAAALAVVPVYGLLRTTSGRRASWMAVALWPAVPALAIFIPKSDCLFPLLAASFLWLWYTGTTRSSRFLCLLAGTTIWLGMFLSLAFLPIGLVAVVWWGAQLWCEANANRRDGPTGAGLAQSICQTLWRRVPLALFSFIGFAAPTALMWGFAKINLLAVWRMNYFNHAGFYQQYARTYWKWLLVNPLEISVAAGLPLVLAALCGIAALARRPAARSVRLEWCWLAIWALLWISGKNMGEAARLWIFQIPLIIWFSGGCFESWNQRNNSVGNDRSQPASWQARNDVVISRLWLACLIAQLVVGSLIVTHAAGFDLLQNLPKSGKLI